MAHDVTVSELQPGIYLALRPLEQMEGGGAVRAALLLGERRAVVVDTLTCPEDMAPLQALIGAHGRPYIVVNTHADWDHFWGNAAFPGAPIVGHCIARERILKPTADEVAEIDGLRAESPAQFANAALVAPDITFETTMAIDLGGMTAELHHLPGHTADCLLVYVPERHLLYAGDCAEDPFPLLHSGPLDGWIAGLRHWAERDVETVVPAHGAIGGAGLLRDNADYLESLTRGGAAPEGVGPFYARGHAENVVAARPAR
jgi:glyoxylase-like metal-dependent hydrolase (beta-lactamase superfamily II)